MMELLSDALRDVHRNARRPCVELTTGLGLAASHLSRAAVLPGRAREGRRDERPERSDQSAATTRVSVRARGEDRRVGRHHHDEKVDEKMIDEQREEAEAKLGVARWKTSVRAGTTTSLRLSIMSRNAPGNEELEAVDLKAEPSEDGHEKNQALEQNDQMADE
mmetsp:Transcript_65459/g.213052  ORF Transcript_65459/g.213052 Transcript_65459/m.213052 type:complete len:163 (-) Transcript_65459:1030-1518(-)